MECEAVPALMAADEAAFVWSIAKGTLKLAGKAWAKLGAKRTVTHAGPTGVLSFGPSGSAGGRVLTAHHPLWRYSAIGHLSGVRSRA